MTVSFQHLCHIIYLQVPFSRQSVKWERNDMEKDILHYQISCTRTLVVSHWPLCPVGPQPRIKVGSSCKSSSSSCDEKRFWKKPWRCQGHQGQDLHWTFAFFQMDVAPVRPACFFGFGDLLYSGKGNWKGNGSRFLKGSIMSIGSSDGQEVD